MNDADKMRALFEKACMPYFYDDPSNFKWDGAVYVDVKGYGNRVQIAWQAWRAATAQQNETIAYWQKDSADAWDTCEKRRLENVNQDERIKDLEAQIEHQRAMLSNSDQARNKK